MILKQATIFYKGYDPDKLSKGSRKKICCSCDNPECKNPIRYISMYAYRSLCGSCSHIGNKNGMFEKNHTNKSKKLISENRIYKIGKNNPNYKPKIILICKECGNEYPVIPANKNKSKFCSNKCQGKWNSKNLVGSKNPNYNNHKLAGENNPQWGKFGKESSGWKGGLPLRDHVLNERDCIKLNKRFKNSEGHHINKNMIIFIPKELHKHISHSLKTDKNMESINKLAFNYLIGDI